MVRSFVRLAAAAGFSMFLAGCAGTADFDDNDNYTPQGRRAETGTPLQCVPYAREQSGIMIFGDAYTWWDKAEGRFARASMPSEGAVMVLYNYAGPNRGHVAVVREIVNEREIRVDHANWLDDGAIYTGDPVRDVSPDNDWSQVRVFNIRAGAWGGRTYPVQGFIGRSPDNGNLYMAQNPSPARKADPIATLITSDDDLANGDLK
jgi:surface antigen